MACRSQFGLSTKMLRIRPSREVQGNVEGWQQLTVPFYWIPGFTWVRFPAFVSAWCEGGSMGENPTTKVCLCSLGVWLVACASGLDDGGLGGAGGGAQSTSLAGTPTSATVTSANATAANTASSSGSTGAAAVSSSSASASATSVASTSANTVAVAVSASNGGGPCEVITMIMPAFLRVTQPAGPDFTSQDSFHCVPTGQVTLEARCLTDGGQDPPVSVNWGSGLCPADGTTCTFVHSSPTGFQTILSPGASCP